MARRHDKGRRSTGRPKSDGAERAELDGEKEGAPTVRDRGLDPVVRRDHGGLGELSKESGIVCFGVLEQRDDRVNDGGEVPRTQEDGEVAGPRPTAPSPRAASRKAAEAASVLACWSGANPIPSGGLGRSKDDAPAFGLGMRDLGVGARAPAGGGGCQGGGGGDLAPVA